MSNIPGDREITFVVLSCLHTATYIKPAPKIGDYAYCFKCDGYKRAAVRPNAYRLECLDCSKLRQSDYGGRTHAAEIAADKHARKYRGHRVRVFNGSEFVREAMHVPEDTLLDVAPF